jgi:hypothetical protein
MLFNSDKCVLINYELEKSLFITFQEWISLVVMEVHEQNW